MVQVSVTSVKIYKAALHKELNTNAGGLWKHLAIAGDKAVAGAKRHVGVKSGRLRKSIHKRHLGTANGQYLLIGSWTVDYALAHHQGTRPHLIAPNPGKPLVFASRGRVIRMTTPVNHPGTRANPYLTRQLYHFRSI